jgi:hypothetical protein
MTGRRLKHRHAIHPTPGKARHGAGAFYHRILCLLDSMLTGPLPGTLDGDASAGRGGSCFAALNGTSRSRPRQAAGRFGSL